MTDLISRQDAIALLEGILDNCRGSEGPLPQAIEALTNMPSAEIPIRFDEWDAIP